MLLAKIAAPLVLAATALAQTFSIATPASLIQCQPAALSWTGGTQPFIIAAIPAGQVSAQAISTIATGLTASPYTWTVNLASGLNITLKITDNLGNLAYSSPLVIQAGVSNACLNTSASTSGLSTVSVSAVSTVSGSSGVIASTSAPATTSSASTVGPVSSASSTAGSTSSAAASSSSASTSRPASSAAASSTAWAMPSAVAGLPAIAFAAVGGLAALL